MTADHKVMREALEKAAPGPWVKVKNKNDIAQGQSDADGYRLLICKMYPLRENDADLIANAPEWLRQLLDESEAQEKLIAYKDEQFRKLLAENRKLLDENERLRAENKKIRDKQLRQLGLPMRDLCERMVCENEQLQADKESALETLRWYADETNYEMVETLIDEYSTETTSATWQDSGERARTAIERLERGEANAQARND